MKQILKKVIANKYFFSALICLSLVFGIGALGAFANVQFNGDAELVLSGVPAGSLYIASGSEIVSMNVVGSTLTVDNIPAGLNFTLKTPQHTNALKISSPASALGLIFEGGNLSSGNITKWVLTGTGALTVNHTVGTPLANTDYIVKVDGVAFGTYKSSVSSEIAFIYNSTFSLPKTFTVEGSGVNPTPTPGVSPTPTPTSTPGPAVPSAPQTLTSQAGDNAVSLSWLAPSYVGGSPITGYKVYRGTTSGAKTLLTTSGCSNLGNVLTCTDSTVANGTTYYYQVTALNSIGESARSNEVIANPQVTKIQGTVSNSFATPIQGATVSDGTRFAITDANGNYTINTVAGTYTLTASKTSYASQSKTVSVSAAQTATVNFTLTFPTFTADLNLDGIVNSVDFGIMMSFWNSMARPAADINQDGIVNSVDFGIMMSQWG